MPTDTRRLLFLDFDGVMHPFRCGVGQYFCHLELLEAWLRQRPSVDVVISSSWREVHPLNEMRSYFSQDIQRRIVGATPQLNFAERHLEVTRWLEEHGATGEGREADEGRAQVWAVLDDQAELFPPNTARLVVCDGRIGLTLHDLTRLDAILQLGHAPGTEQVDS